MEILPTLTDGTPWYDFTVELEGITFQFEFFWNDRESDWYFNLYDSGSNPVLMGIKVTLSVGLFGRFKGSNLPNGDLLALDTSGQDLMPGIQDLGDRVLLVYVDSTDVASLVTGTFVPTAT